MEALEEELSRQARVREVLDGGGERAILVGVDTGEGPEAEAALRELAELTRTAGGVPVKRVLVFRPSLDPRYLVGLGKLEELKSLAYHENAATLIFGLELSPAQAREIERATGLKVLDRTQLILDIFALHAKTPEAQAQVELAQLKYLLPRLVGKGKEMSRLGGGIGTRGPGETKLEVDRRRLQERIAHLTRRLEEYARSARRPGGRGSAGGCPSSPWWAIPTPARPPSSRPWPGAGSRGRTSSSPPYGPSPGGGSCPGWGRCSSPTPWASSATCRGSSSPPSGPPSRRCGRRTFWSTSWTLRRRELGAAPGGGGPPPGPPGGGPKGSGLEQGRPGGALRPPLPAGAPGRGAGFGGEGHGAEGAQGGPGRGPLGLGGEAPGLAQYT